MTKTRRKGIGKQVLTLLAKGRSVEDVARIVDCSCVQVRSVRARAKKPKKYALMSKIYGRARYGTDAYREQNREYVRKRSKEDADYRARRNAAVAKYRERKKMAALMAEAA